MLSDHMMAKLQRETDVANVLSQMSQLVHLPLDISPNGIGSAKQDIGSTSDSLASTGKSGVIVDPFIHDPNNSGAYDDSEHTYAQNTETQNEQPSEKEKSRQKSSGKKKYTCETCNKTFSKLCNLKSHIRVHTGERPFTCTVCARSFSNVQDLVRHRRIHSGEKPFKCEICGLRFTDFGSRKRHTRIHTNDNPHKCPICLKTFPRADTLRSHVALHSDSKPYKCEFCGKTFSYNNSFKRHLASTHSGEKNFTCHTCNRKFTRRDYLQSHAKVHEKRRLAEELTDSDELTVDESDRPDADSLVSSLHEQDGDLLLGSSAGDMTSTFSAYDRISPIPILLSMAESAFVNVHMPGNNSASDYLDEAKDLQSGTSSEFHYGTALPEPTYFSSRRDRADLSTLCKVSMREALNNPIESRCNISFEDQDDKEADAPVRVEFLDKLSATNKDSGAACIEVISHIEEIADDCDRMDMINDEKVIDTVRPRTVSISLDKSVCDTPISSDYLGISNPDSDQSSDRAQRPKVIVTSMDMNQSSTCVTSIHEQVNKGSNIEQGSSLDVLNDSASSLASKHATLETMNASSASLVSQHPYFQTGRDFQHVNVITKSDSRSESVANGPSENHAISLPEMTASVRFMPAAGSPFVGDQMTKVITIRPFDVAMGGLGELLKSLSSPVVGMISHSEEALDSKITNVRPTGPFDSGNKEAKSIELNEKVKSSSFISPLDLNVNTIPFSSETNANTNPILSAAIPIVTVPDANATSIVSQTNIDKDSIMSEKNEERDTSSTTIIEDSQIISALSQIGRMNNPFVHCTINKTDQENSSSRSVPYGDNRVRILPLVAQDVEIPK